MALTLVTPAATEPITLAEGALASFRPSFSLLVSPSQPFSGRWDRLAQIGVPLILWLAQSV